MNEQIIDLLIEKPTDETKIIALAGNPNVGKSTVFNSLTGLRQHTGNWPGKTVTSARGDLICGGYHCVIVDLPGTYSLMAHSVDEEVARNFICFGGSDAVIVVCDATCLERNLNLALQTIEITKNTVICVNLMDEAAKKGVKINIKRLSQLLGVPVVATCARSNKGLLKLTDTVSQVFETPPTPVQITYTAPIEQAISMLTPLLQDAALSPRWVAIRLLEGASDIAPLLENCVDIAVLESSALRETLLAAQDFLAQNGYPASRLRDALVSCLVLNAEGICNEVITLAEDRKTAFDRRLDHVLTGRLTAFPLMAIMLAGVFWLTISGANYPSKLLSDFLFSLEPPLLNMLTYIGIPHAICRLAVFGIYRVVAWVVSVMLPPMAIFFPLFTLLEDFGYLPRVAFNLDKAFQKCGACGKQSLSMCMGFGCNAAGIIGCRIIDSPRERLIAMLTNNFVPCNGRFPLLITITTIFFAGSAGGFGGSVISALLLTCVIMAGVGMTFALSGLLSKTVLRGVPSSFTLELPPYRKPQIGRVLVRSVFDRTLFVLSRAVSVAIPAGLIIWLMANIWVGDMTILTRCSQFLDPLGKLLGMDGVILLAFILGFPANEIVLPIVIMCYMSTDSIMELSNLVELKQLFVQNGWTWITAGSTMIFSLMHWPCSTTLLTMKKESQSALWTAAAFLIPTVCGGVLCSIFAALARIIMLFSN